jgi:hypothetical protein
MDPQVSGCDLNLASDMVGGAVKALVTSVLLSFSVIYGLNRYLAPIDGPPRTPGIERQVPNIDTPKTGTATCMTFYADDRHREVS